MPITSTNPTRLLESMKSLYKADQQVKFLHLQAEVESLLIELQTIKQQRLTASDSTEASYDTVKR